MSAHPFTFIIPVKNASAVFLKLFDFFVFSLKQFRCSIAKAEEVCPTT